MSVNSQGLERGVLIVGAGLLGASLGLALRRHGVDVRLRDSSPAALDAAVSRGAGRISSPDDERASLAVVAVPPVAVGPAVVDLLAADAADYVTDVASVKAEPTAYVREHAAEPGRYVGSHPMAGREVSGPAAALVDLFEGRRWVLCPDDATDHQAVARVLAMVRLAGAMPITMTADEHDAAVALVSHAPYALSVLVAGRLADASPQYVRLAGAGVSDVTRVAASDPALWDEILRANASAVKQVLGDFRVDLDRMLTALDDDKSSLVDLLESGVSGRARLPGKHGAERAEFATIYVTLDDRPGQLARLFADTSAAGVNVEDVRIEHIPGQPEGVAELDVTPAAADELVTELSKRGWAAVRP